MIDPLSIYLAKLLGLAFMIIGIALFSKPKDYQDTIKGIAHSNCIMTLVSIIPLTIGLSIIIAHNIWVKNWIVLITIIGWLIFIKGILRLFYHKEIMQLLLKISNSKKFFIWFGLILFILGVYLAGKGFNKLPF